jgi:hypothetical protein
MRDRYLRFLQEGNEYSPKFTFSYREFLGCQQGSIFPVRQVLIFELQYSAERVCAFLIYPFQHNQISLYREPKRVRLRICTHPYLTPCLTLPHPRDDVIDR